MNVVKGEFPFLRLSPSMARRLWQKQLQQVKQLSRPLTSSNPTKKVCDLVSHDPAVVRSHDPAAVTGYSRYRKLNRGRGHY